MSELDEASFNLDDKDCIEVDVNAFVADNKLSCLILCASLDNQQLKGCIANFKFILPLYQKLWSLADRWHTCFKLQKEIPQLFVELVGENIEFVINVKETFDSTKAVDVINIGLILILDVYPEHIIC